jgi:hypothetical protein
MNQSERDEYIADGIDARRCADFMAGRAATERWQRERPASLDDFVEFLEAFQSMFGPLHHAPGLPWQDFRL